MARNGWERTGNRLAKGPGSAVAWLLFAGLPLVVVVVVVFWVLGFFGNAFNQGRRIIDKTIDADNVIANYEWFKQRHESIQAIDGKIVDSQEAVDAFKAELGPRKDWHREDRIEHDRLNTVLLGLKQQREDMAAEYNARSRMVNRSIFKTGDTQLPERIE